MGYSKKKPSIRPGLSCYASYQSQLEIVPTIWSHGTDPLMDFIFIRPVLITHNNINISGTEKTKENLK